MYVQYTGDDRRDAERRIALAGKCEDVRSHISWGATPMHTLRPAPVGGSTPILPNLAIETAPPSTYLADAVTQVARYLPACQASIYLYPAHIPSSADSHPPVANYLPRPNMPSHRSAPRRSTLHPRALKPFKSHPGHAIRKPSYQNTVTRFCCLCACKRYASAVCARPADNRRRWLSGGTGKELVLVVH